MKFWAFPVALSVVLAACVSPGASLVKYTTLDYCINTDNWLCLSGPLDYDEPAVMILANAKHGETVELEWQGHTRTATVYWYDTHEAVQVACGNPSARGCTSTFEPTEVHMLRDRRTTQLASHELCHVFDMEGCDKPEITQYNSHWATEPRSD